MDYGDLINSSFRLTWRYKYLWALGLLAGFGGNGGSYNVGSGFLGAQDGNGPSGADVERVIVWLQTHMALIFALILLGFLAMVGFFLIGSWAAAALVNEVDDLEHRDEDDGEPPRGFLSAWAKGRSAFGRVVGLRLLVGLIVLGFVALAVVPLVLLGLLIAAQSPIAVVVGILAGVLLALILLAAIPFIVALSIAQQLALRYVVLRQKRAVEGLKAGFRLLRANLGQTLLLWLITVGLGMAAGPVLLVAILLIAVPVGLLVFIMFQIGPVTGVTSLALAALVLIPLLFTAGGAMSAYFSTYWTLAFSQLSPVSESVEI